MTEYISKEDALKFLTQQADEVQKDADENGGESVIYAECLEDVIADFERLPAADVAPVVHAEWIPFHSEAAGDIQYCSNCKIGNAAKSGFCPHCGAIISGWRRDPHDIDKDPTANVALIVRCINCKYIMARLTNGPVDGPFCGHPNGLRVIFRDSFCPYGKRRG